MQSCKTPHVLVLTLYSLVTIHDFTRGIIHTFLYDEGLNNISGLGTNQKLCDDRITALMIAYGGGNLESFLVRLYILYRYVRHNHERDLICVSSIASALWTPVTAIVSSIGNIDVGNADLPGKYVMLIRSLMSLVTLVLLAF